MNAHAQRPEDQAPRIGESVDDLVGDVERLEAVIAGWDESQRTLAFAYRHAIDDLHKNALRKLIASVKIAPGALDALREAASDPLVYAVLRHHGLIRASLQERVEQALASIRPMLASHGGDVEFVAFLPPDAVEVRFVGNCDHCPSSTLTFVAGVKQAIEEYCPEIKDVRQVKGSGTAQGKVDYVSPFSAGLEAKWRLATTLESIPEQGVKAFAVDGAPFIFSRLSRVVSCFRDACAHLGSPISGGVVAEGRITCPRHGFEYDLMSGECLTAPVAQLQAIAVRLVGERVEIRFEG
ncbi:Fe-S cluster biogenesis protein NfuA [Methylocapsa aurea]|uniref:Fe-S cluster biogenesis protein NfuA n=1 Tax=Methylocapsa aurea TaxID=663610 RepID=UPI00068D969D|nr:Fe-S cluster biogenesis protein NfuA [Methylocapsa aurea]